MTGQHYCCSDILLKILYTALVISASAKTEKLHSNYHHFDCLEKVTGVLQEKITLKGTEGPA